MKMRKIVNGLPLCNNLLALGIFYLNTCFIIPKIIFDDACSESYKLIRHELNAAAEILLTMPLQFKRDGAKVVVNLPLAFLSKGKQWLSLFNITEIIVVVHLSY